MDRLCAGDGGRDGVSGEDEGVGEEDGACGEDAEWRRDDDGEGVPAETSHDGANWVAAIHWHLSSRPSDILTSRLSQALKRHHRRILVHTRLFIFSKVQCSFICQ